MSPDLAACRARHPSARWPGPVEDLQSRVERVLDLQGARHTEVAAAVLGARGRTGLGPARFAGRLGIDPELLGRAEAGELDRAELPAPLRRLVERR